MQNLVDLIVIMLCKNLVFTIMIWNINRIYLALILVSRHSATVTNCVSLYDLRGTPEIN